MGSSSWWPKQCWWPSVAHAQSCAPILLWPVPKPSRTCLNWPWSQTKVWWPRPILSSRHWTLSQNSYSNLSGAWRPYIPPPMVSTLTGISVTGPSSGDNSVVTGHAHKPVRRHLNGSNQPTAGAMAPITPPASRRPVSLAVGVWAILVRKIPVGHGVPRAINVAS